MLISSSDIIRRVKEEYNVKDNGLVCLEGFRNVRAIYECNGLKLELDETHYGFGESSEPETRRLRRGGWRVWGRRPDAEERVGVKKKSSIVKNRTHDL